MERVLQRGGFSVIAVRNGRQALKAFSQYADNLTLMLVGVETPVMAGAEFVEIIPTLTPRIPVVFTSTQSERAISALTRSGYPLLYKPFAPVDLLEAVWAVVPKGDPLAS
jgi:CheY-like chemotaxis protein